MSKVTPPGLPGKGKGDGGAGRASWLKNPNWPLEQLAEFRSQIAKLRRKSFEQDTEAKRKPDDKSRLQPGQDDVASKDPPVDPKE